MQKFNEFFVRSNYHYSHRFNDVSRSRARLCAFWLIGVTYILGSVRVMRPGGHTLNMHFSQH